MAMTVGTTFSYNGVCMQDCTLDGWQHSIMYDESNNVKWDLIRFTVSSQVVSNHRLVNENAWPSGNTNPMRLHPSQVYNPDPTINNEIRLTGIDQLNEIDAQLHVPMQDLVLWVNNASEDPNVADQAPEAPKTRSSHRRILVAATGTPGVADYAPISGVTSTSDVGNYLQCADPWDSSGWSTLDVLRRQVLDCNRGPRCLEFKIQPLAGSMNYRVSVTFEVCRPIRKELNSMDPAGTADRKAEEDYLIDVKSSQAIVYNRWSLTDSLSDSGVVTHRISGQLVVSDRRYKANAMRLMAFPLAFPFARLAGREYSVSSDGKTLAYSIAFSHAGAAPPMGIRDYQSSYTERWALDVPGMNVASMAVRVKGWFHRSTENASTMVSEATQKIVLLRGAHTILFARISGVAQAIKTLPGQPKSVTLLNMVVIEQVGRPELELRVDVLYGSANTNGLLDIYLRMENFGREFYQGASGALPVGIPAYDPKWWPIDNEFGRLLNLDQDNFFMDYSPLEYQNSAAARAKADYTNSYAGTFEKTPAVPPITNPPRDYTLNGQEATNGMSSYIGGPEDDDYSATVKSYVPTTNPIKQPTFSAIVAVGLDGVLIPATQSYTPKSGAVSAFSDNQLQGNFAYITYEAEVLDNAKTGIVMLPLSKPREITSAGTMAPGGYTSIKPMETVAVGRLHAGAGRRVVSIKAERKDDWPDIPAPTERIDRTSLIDGSQRVALVERLIQKEVINEAPQTIATGNMGVYTTHLRLTYAMSRPWAPTAEQSGAGVSIDELFPVPENKILRYSGAAGEAKSVVASTYMSGNYA